jgi:hypothetical protein
MSTIELFVFTWDTFEEERMKIERDDKAKYNNILKTIEDAI